MYYIVILTIKIFTFRNNGTLARLKVLHFFFKISDLLERVEKNIFRKNRVFLFSRSLFLSFSFLPTTKKLIARRTHTIVTKIYMFLFLSMGSGNRTHHGRCVKALSSPEEPTHVRTVRIALTTATMSMS